MIFIRVLFSSLLSLGLVALLSVPAHAARIYLEPAGGTMIAGCTKTVLVRIDHNGSQSNTTQVYVSDNLTGANESASFVRGTLYSDYFVPPNIPTGLDALVGYTFSTVSGNAQTFGQLRLRSNTINKNVSVNIEYDEDDDLTSKVYNSGVNYLTEVSGGSYTVVDGFCDTIQPNVINTIPLANEPNHPVAGDITFDITDNDSGVAIDTLQVTVTQAGNSVVYTEVSDQLTFTEFNTLDYRIRINPDQPFIPQTLVTITVQVADRAGNVRTMSWSFNGLTCEALGCGGATITQCNDGEDNDGDGLVDMADSGCTSPGDNNEFTVGSVNQCNDGLDNDGDGSIDSADAGCRSESESGTTPPGGTITEFVTTTITTTVSSGTNSEVAIPDCRDGRDNDGDGNIDFPDDTGCTSPNDDDEYEQPIDAIVDSADLFYFLANRTIEVQAGPNRIVQALISNSFGVDVRIDDITIPFDSIELHTEFGIYPLLFDNSTGRYRTDITLPGTAGFSDAFVRVTYQDGTIESVPFRLNMLPFGTVTSYAVDDTTPINEGTVRLEVFENDAFRVVDQMLIQNGRYAFLVPNGTYRVVTEVPGYRADSSVRFRVTNHIVNYNVALRPEIQLLDPEVPLEEKIAYAAASISEQVSTVQELLNDPVVEDRARQTVAPIAAAVTTAAILPALSALGLLNYFRFLFLQPLLLFGRKKRKGWGYVYNTLTRKPLDLAQVRLIDSVTNRVVQSRVTDMNGRYIFFADPGTYRIEVAKEQFVFPTTLLVGEREDGPYLDIYHGEPIRVTEEHTVIAANIPVDPVTAEKTPRRIYVEKITRTLQSWLSAIGVLAGVAAALISPSALTIGLLVVQLVVLGIFAAIAKPKKPKNWGIVYDATNKKRLDRVIVRLFSKRFDKLVTSDFTDAKGRYAFLVNPNEYYVTYQKTGYVDDRKDVNIQKESDVVSESIALRPKQKE